MTKPPDNARVIYKTKAGRLDFGYYDADQDAILCLTGCVGDPLSDVLAWYLLETAWNVMMIYGYKTGAADV